MMNNRLTALAASLLFAATSLFAQDAPRARDALFRIISVTGDCQVQRPTLASFEPAAAKMYPLGTVVRAAAGGEVILGYNNNYEFTLTGPGEVLVGAGVNGPLLQLVLSQGKLRAAFVKSTQDGDVVIETPGFTSLPGPEVLMSIDAVREAGGLVSSTVTFERGTGRLFGPQFNIPVLRVGNSLRLLSALDRSLTRITGLLGELPVQLDNNTDIPTEFTMRPGAAIKITRQFSPVTGREGVSVLIINENGVGHASYAFVLGDALLATEGVLRTIPKEIEPGAADAQPLLPDQNFPPASATDDDFGGFGGFDFP